MDLDKIKRFSAGNPDRLIIGPWVLAVAAAFLPGLAADARPPGRQG